MLQPRQDKTAALCQIYCMQPLNGISLTTLEEMNSRKELYQVEKYKEDKVDEEKDCAFIPKSDSNDLNKIMKDVQRLNQTMKNIEQEQVKMKQDNTELKKENAEMKKDIDHLKKENVKLKKENAEMKKEMAELRKEC
nr:unnamed protein product [Naegleria fowleri]